MQNLGAAHANLDQKVYQILKTMIMERKLLPGEKIRQEKLAQDLGISRTPLVAALKFLEHEKLVESKPRRGFFVRLFKKQEMISIFELREVLEGLAARRAATHITDPSDRPITAIFPSVHQAPEIRITAATPRRIAGSTPSSSRSAPRNSCAASWRPTISSVSVIRWFPRKAWCGRPTKPWGSIWR
jgi:DNA-binding FadR family transcriptional regulator